MSSHFVRDCGHRTLRDPWGDGEEHLSGQCIECRKSRIGEIINFVRYGDFPLSGKSNNYRDNSTEDGISVYELKNGNPIYVGFYFNFLDMKKITGTGKIVGWGSDGEPLVEILTYA